MRTTLWMLLIGTLMTSMAEAQTRTDGSVYSRFGVGELYAFSSAQAAATGGLGTALFSTSYVSLSNPATWSRSFFTRFSGTYHLQSVQSTDARNQTTRLNAGRVGSFKLSFPLLRQRWGFVAAFTPFSRVAYRVREERTFPAPTGEPETTYEMALEGTGGLQQILVGTGYQLTPTLSVGADFRFVFGIIEHIRRTSFSDPARYLETRVNVSTQLTGATGTVGMLFQLPKPFIPEDLLSIGLAFTLPTYLQGEQVQTLGEDLKRDTLSTLQRGSVTLPWSLRAGLAYYRENQWTAQLDAQYAPWSSFKSELPLPGYEPGGQSRMTNSWRIGGGIEFLPAGTDVTRSYLARTAYRIGFYAEQAYFKPSGNLPLRTYALTAGLSLPTLMQGTRFDLSFEGGIRGTTRAGLVRDLYYMISVTLNIGEFWFIKRRFG